MRKTHLIFIAVLLLAVSQALLSARYGISAGGVGFYDGH
jgi:hypothetical protein